MINHQYSYLIGTIFLFGIWLMIYLKRKDIRKEMLGISVFFLLFSFTEIIYYYDWWRPQTITHTIIGFESFLFAFSYSGIVSVLYEVVFQKQLRRTRLPLSLRKNHKLYFLVEGTLLVGLFLYSFFVLHINSLLTILITLTTGIILIWIYRPDLIMSSIISGILSVIIMVPVFLFTEFITPGVVLEFWLFKNVAPIIILGVPIDDFLFYLFTGMFIGPLYEYWHESRLVTLKKNT